VEIGLFVVGAGLGAVLALMLARRRSGLDQHGTVEAIVAELRHGAATERDAAVRVALEQAAIMNRSQLDAGLAAGREELTSRSMASDARLEHVERQLRDELGRVGELVNQLGRNQAASMRGVEATLAAHAESTAALANTAQSLREALASPKARGQWGERMAEDVLRLAGFVEHVNYEKQTAVEGGRVLPDFTFPLPKGHVLYMDVKFPLSAYVRFLEAGTDAERSAHRDAFLRDVRLRVRELATRDYAHQGTAASVDYVLLFLPNETVSSFIHENDPGLVEDALNQKVVLCSPLTLFALLGVIRQAFDNFMVEQTSAEILGVLGAFGQQWEKFVGALDVVGKRIDAAQRAYDDVSGTRRRQLERPLQRLDALRTERGIPADERFLPEADVVSIEELGA
jgi:DNA recombination protein RmuC